VLAGFRKKIATSILSKICKESLMISQDTIDKIRQKKLEALVAMHLHDKRVHKFRQRNLLIEFLTIAVPAFYIVPRFLIKGTAGAAFVEIIWELLAAILLVLAIFRVVFKWQDNEIRHSIMSRKNADISREADHLLSKKTTNDEVIEQFLKHVTDVDAEDRDLLLDVTKKEDQKAYREGLKQLATGATTLCPKCGADPWHFVEGNCEACGGTPTRSSK
jgi:mobilome CxxCx(11)CxxC protein